MKNVDVVYVLGTGSGWKNNELRFSLRSIEKNGINAGKIFVVGEQPEFLTNVIHIPASDVFNPNVNADGNIIVKVLAACADKRLSEDFLFINDDHLILKPIDLNNVPAFHKGDMNGYDEIYWQPLNYWRSCRLKRTMDILNERGLTAFHFDCHTPILFNKDLFPEVISRFNYSEGSGLTMKSLYGNSVYSKSRKRLKGEKKKVFMEYSLNELEKRLEDCGFMSFNDDGLNKALKIWLYRKFPERSHFELTNIEDRTIEMYRWLDKGRDYDEGVRIFEKYLHGANLIRMFRSGNNEILRKKLEFKLTNAISEL